MAVALVTGSNRGIGLETAFQLADSGHTVVLTARSEDSARDAATALAERGVTVDPRQLDVSDEASILRLADEVKIEHGVLDILINNAGINYDTFAYARDVDLDQVRQTLEVNLFGAWRMVQVFLPLLTMSAHPRVVNVSSGLGSLSTMGAGTPAYATSKAALNAMTRILADELRAQKILVNAVCPGWIATDMGGEDGGPVAEGAASVLWGAELPDDGPSGGLFRHGISVPW